MKLYVCRLFEDGKRIDEIIKSTSASLPEVVEISSAEEFLENALKGNFRNERILFAIELDETGVNMELCQLMKEMNRLVTEHLDTEDGDVGKLMEGAVCGILVDGRDDYYTKETGRNLAFCINRHGGVFPGKSLVEATGNLSNYSVLARVKATDFMGAYRESTSELIERLVTFRKGNTAKERPKVLAIHASDRKTSNTLQLWSMVCQSMGDRCDIEEISIRNGQVEDCRGCKYETCLHYGENSGCFYGGVIEEKVYPAILNCDCLVLICPNYNDSVSANLMAMINRLTALFRTKDFSEKRIYALIVSGYSGGDIVAKQIMGAMNMNKNFILPGNFAMTETANDPGTIGLCPGIDKRIKEFADRLCEWR